MLLQESIALISQETFKPSGQQLWYDLGAGTGMFTMALAHLLDERSKIVAVDRNASSLRQIPATMNNVVIETQHSDFTKSALPYQHADGILMANSFHYVKNKKALIHRLATNLKPLHSFLIIEYDTEKWNPWVPFPISFLSLKKFFEDEGYESVIKLNDRKSAYGRSMMYAAIIRNKN